MIREALFFLSFPYQKNVFLENYTIKEMISNFWLIKIAQIWILDTLIGKNVF